MPEEQGPVNWARARGCFTRQRYTAIIPTGNRRAQAKQWILYLALLRSLRSSWQFQHSNTISQTLWPCFSPVRKLGQVLPLQFEMNGSDFTQSKNYISIHSFISKQFLNAMTKTKHKQCLKDTGGLCGYGYRGHSWPDIPVPRLTEKEHRLPG